MNEHRNKPVLLPEQKNYEHAYELAYKLACEQINKIGDIAQQCIKSGAQYQPIDSQKVIILQYLNQSFSITLPGVEIAVVGSSGEVPLRDKLLLLHYFISAKGTPLANRLITFRELPEGGVYFPTFVRRTINPLLTHFVKNPRILFEAGEKLGGEKTAYGDMAVTINAFSRVPITIVLWQGDEELSAQGSVLFDATITDYLPTEDITVLCETITWRLVRSIRGA